MSSRGSKSSYHHNFGEHLWRSLQGLGWNMVALSQVGIPEPRCFTHVWSFQHLWTGAMKSAVKHTVQVNTSGPCHRGFHGGFQLGKWWYPIAGWFISWTILLEWSRMDDDWGYPNWWKPPNVMDGNCNLPSWTLGRMNPYPGARLGTTRKTLPVAALSTWRWAIRRRRFLIRRSTWTLRAPLEHFSCLQRVFIPQS